MKKILALTAISAGLFAGNASALNVDVAVNWVQKTAGGVATGVSGTEAAGVFQYEIANTPLSSADNQPSYRIDFSIAAPTAVAGYTFDHTEWYIGTKNEAGGSATTTNVAGSVLTDLYSATRSAVGTTVFGNDLLTFAQTQALAGGSFLNGAAFANPTVNLTTTDFTATTGGYVTNNALNLYALATATDTFTSDGNSNSAFINFAQFAIAARNVYTLNPPPVQVPEPASLAILGLGFAAMGFAARRKRSA